MSALRIKSPPEVCAKFYFHAKRLYLLDRGLIESRYSINSEYMWLSGSEFSPEKLSQLLEGTRKCFG